MVSPENVPTSNIMQTKQDLFSNKYVYTNTYMHTVSEEKRGHEFEGECHGMYGRVWKGKGKC